MIFLPCSTYDRETTVVYNLCDLPFSFSYIYCSFFYLDGFSRYLFKFRGSSVAELELLYINFLLTEREGRMEEYWPDGVVIRGNTEGFVVVVVVVVCFFPIAFTRYNCSPSRLNSQSDEQDESGSISVVDEILPECSLAFTFGIGKEVGSKGMLFR